jgi:hypothetical protein
MVAIMGGKHLLTPNIRPRTGEKATFSGDLSIERQCPITAAGDPCDHPEGDVSSWVHDSYDGSVGWVDKRGKNHRALPVSGISTLTPANPQNQIVEPMLMIKSQGGWKEMDDPAPSIDDAEQEMQCDDDDDDDNGGDSGQQVSVQ